MTSRLIPRVKGLIPLVDRKQIVEPYVVAGKNFVVTAQGPVSALGREIVSYKGINNPENIQFFEVSETVESFICTDEGIFRLDTETTKLVCLHKFTFRLDSQYPFTKAAVGNKYYFARFGYPMLEYDISTQSWTELSGGSIPENIYACEESEGRLVVLTDTFVAWSAIGVGTDFVASASTGAGAQALTKIGFSNSTPIGLRKTPEGFLVFLSSGIIRSQAIQAQNPYRHTILSRSHKPLNPFCLSTTVDESIIVLTAGGFFKTQGPTLEPWQPLMGQYFAENIIPFLDSINNQNNPQLFFDFDNRWFVVAISENQTNYEFTKAFILNLTLDEWGSLDTNFVTLVNVKILPLIFIGFSYGLVDTQGSIFIINNAKGIEKMPELSNGLYHNKLTEEVQGIINDDILRFSIHSDWRTLDTSLMVNTGLYTSWGDGYEYVDPENIVPIEKETVLTVDVLEFRMNTVSGVGIIDVSTVALPKEYDSLNSLITVGPFRLLDEEVNDRYSYINKLMLGMSEEAVGEILEDWNSSLQYPNEVVEDWNLLDGEEDWGDAPVGITQFILSIVPTLDGYTPITEDNTTLELVSHEGVLLTYSCYSQGIYHLLTLDATELDDNFYLKTIDMTINQGGLLL